MHACVRACARARACVRACVCVGVRVGVCVCVRVYTSLGAQWKRFEINMPIFKFLYATKKSSKDIFDDGCCNSLPWPTFWRSKIWIVTISTQRTCLSHKCSQSKYYYCHHRKSLIGSEIVYLHLTLTHSRNQSQGHASFDGEYVINGDRTSTTISDT